MEIPNFAKFYHEKALGIAIFFGRVSWADEEARALGYSPTQRRQVLMETHEWAADRSRTIYGNERRERFHRGEYMRLLKDENALSLTEYKQARLF